MTGTDFWIRFVIAGLATWRVTHLLSREDGPGDVIYKIRARLGAGFGGRLMDCFKCLSLWVAAPLAVFVGGTPAQMALAWLALSGAACLLERPDQQPVVIRPISTQEGSNTDDELLWSKEELPRVQSIADSRPVGH